MSAAVPREQPAGWRAATLGSRIARMRLGVAVPSGRFRFSVILLGAIVVFAVLGPIVLGRDDPLKIVGGLYDPPSRAAWLGTDNFGRDVFTQLMHGTRTSLVIGGIAGAVATAIGVVLGTVAGFRGGLVEEALMGLTNVILTIPSIVVLILLSIAVGNRSIVTMAIIIGVTSWP